MRLPRIPSLSPIVWFVGGFLLLLDLGIIGLFVAWKLDLLTDVAFDLGHDRGVSEAAQYVKLLWVALCAAWLVRMTRQPVFAVLSALFLGLLVDDAGMLHERAGSILGDALALPAVAGLTPSDFGEILFMALWVGPLFLIGIVAYHRSRPRSRRVAWQGLGAIGLLAAFGVGVDVVHQVLTKAFPHIHGLHSALTLLEEGGEMIVLSGIAMCAFAVVRARSEPLPPGGDGYTPGVPTSWPPSITNRPPVTKEDASEAR